MGLFGFLRRRRDRESALGAIPAPGNRMRGSMQSAQTIDARNVGGLRDDMLEILKRHGIDPMSGQMSAIDASDIPGLQEEIQRHSPGTASTSRDGLVPQGTPG